MSRPPLPTRHANPRIHATLSSGVLPPVKYQILNCQGQDILVGRLKIETPTPNGHAFILRRFDTGAVSLTTMFRAAYPNAPEADEKLEVQWVKDNHDLSGNNGSSKEAHITRLAGVWVSPSLALELGKAYSLGPLIHAVVEAVPDPKANYRRSGKATAAAPTVSPPVTTTTTTASVTTTTTSIQAVKSLPTPSPTAIGPGPAKRRKESSPAPAPAPVPAQVAVTISSPTKIPLPRRSARTKSPAPRSAMTVAPLTAAIHRTPKASRVSASPTKKEETVLTPGDSDNTVVDEENDAVEEGVAGEELRQQDLKEQKALIERLKAQREVGKVIVIDDEERDRGEEVESSEAVVSKRPREEEEELYKFEFREPEVGERAIATNSRVGRFTLEPRTRSFAWGVAAFAFGMGAVTFLPNFF